MRKLSLGLALLALYCGSWSSGARPKHTHKQAASPAKVHAYLLKVYEFINRDLELLEKRRDLMGKIKNGDEVNLADVSQKTVDAAVEAKNMTPPPQCAHLHDLLYDYTLADANEWLLFLKGIKAKGFENVKPSTLPTKDSSVMSRAAMTELSRLLKKYPVGPG